MGQRFTRKMLHLAAVVERARRARGKILLMSIDYGCQMAG